MRRSEGDLLGGCTGRIELPALDECFVGLRRCAYENLRHGGDA